MNSFLPTHISITSCGESYISFWKLNTFTNSLKNCPEVFVFFFISTIQQSGMLDRVLDSDAGRTEFKSSFGRLLCHTGQILFEPVCTWYNGDHKSTYFIGLYEKHCGNLKEHINTSNYLHHCDYSFWGYSKLYHDNDIL